MRTEQPLKEQSLETVAYRMNQLERTVNEHHHSHFGSGSQSAEIIEGIIKSANYVSGTSGWKIDGEGNAEFNSITLSINSSSVSDVDAYTTGQDEQSLSTLNYDSPSGSGLYMDSTHLGYYSGSAWTTYMDSSGNFYLGGTSGKLQWDAGTDTLAIEGSVTITGGSGIDNLTDAGALALKDAISDTDCDTTIISGGKIITGLLTADNIQAGTLTGQTVQTADSGQRVVIDGTGNLIRFYNSGGGDQGAIYGIATGIGITGDIKASSVALDIDNINIGQGAGSGITFTFNNSADIGSSAACAQDIYAGGSLYDDSGNSRSINAIVTASSYSDSDARSAVTGTGLPGDLLSASSYYDLGSPTYPWDNVYCADLHSPSGVHIADLSGDIFDMWAVLTLRSLSSAPAGAANGTIYYDTTLGQIRGKAGGAWYAL